MKKKKKRKEKEQTKRMTYTDVLLRISTCFALVFRCRRNMRASEACEPEVPDPKI